VGGFPPRWGLGTKKGKIPKRLLLPFHREFCFRPETRGPPLNFRSGRESNYEKGKEYWPLLDAGAANVHWVIVDEDQVEQGISQALARVESVGVIVEGNSFLEFTSLICDHLSRPARIS